MLFGLIKLIGVVLFLYLTWRNLNENYKEEQLVTFSWLALFSFLVAGRVAFGLIHFGVWNDSLTDWISFWTKPGFNYWGGIIGMLLLTVWYCQVNSWKIWSFMEEMTSIIYLFLFFILTEEVIKNNFNFQSLCYLMATLLGVIISALISKRYRSLVWYKSGKKGFVFFFTNAIVMLYLVIMSVLFKEDVWVWIVYLILSLISVAGLFILGEVLNNLMVFNKRKNNGKN